MEDFQKLLAQKGIELYRDMPWRDDTRPYYVLVSELMLQQTQVSRVIPKFQQFIARFPDEKALAQASLADVLIEWQGLGYNRRAKFLHEAAKAIVERGTFPDTYEEIIKLPGVGKNTAGAILAYSFNIPTIFIETNIRTVYIHHFFADNFKVDDKQIVANLKETMLWAEGKEQPDRFSHKSDGAMRKTVGLSHYRPREFYWALMDYGSWLKSQGIRNNSLSKHYKKQSPLKGSVREVRGMIVRELTDGELGMDVLRSRMPKDTRFDTALQGLIQENIVTTRIDKVYLTR